MKCKCGGVYMQIGSGFYCKKCFKKLSHEKEIDNHEQTGRQSWSNIGK